MQFKARKYMFKAKIPFSYLFCYGYSRQITVTVILEYFAIPLSILDLNIEFLSKFTIYCLKLYISITASNFYLIHSLWEYLIFIFKNPLISVHLLNVYYVLSICTKHNEELSAHAGKQ